MLKISFDFLLSLFFSQSQITKRSKENNIIILKFLHLPREKGGLTDKTQPQCNLVIYLVPIVKLDFLVFIPSLCFNLNILLLGSVEKRKGWCSTYSCEILLFWCRRRSQTIPGIIYKSLNCFNNVHEVYRISLKTVTYLVYIKRGKKKMLQNSTHNLYKQVSPFLGLFKMNVHLYFLIELIILLPKQIIKGLPC